MSEERLNALGAETTQKAEPMLMGIALGIVAKGRVYKKDALFLGRWLGEHPNLWESPEIQRLRHAANIINITVQEDYDDPLNELHTALNDFLISRKLAVPNIKLKNKESHKNHPANHLCVVIAKDDAIFDHVTCMDFSAQFCFTGNFAFGGREDCEHEAVQLGACIKKNLVQAGKNYLIVGSLSNPQWSTQRQGNKIKDALEYRSRGLDMTILHEDEWQELVLQEQRKRGII